MDNFISLQKSCPFAIMVSKKRGVKIKIIHNVDRIEEEMVSAIRGWLPLYLSGMIEPFVFRKSRNARFYHTVFLRSGGACIHGFFPAQGGDSRWYEYITDKKRLDLLERGYCSFDAYNEAGNLQEIAERFYEREGHCDRKV